MHTNGPGRLVGRGSPQNANFTTYPATESFQFSIGSAKPPNIIKKPRQAHFVRKTSTGGTVLHKRPFDVDPMETARRAEAERRADYDRRVEIAWREEHERRMAHALDLAFSQTRNPSITADYEVQFNRLKQMGKMIDTLSTMINKPSQHEAAAAEPIATTLMSSCSQSQVLEANIATVARFGLLRANNDKVTVRKIVRIHRDPHAYTYEECEDWSLRMTKEEGEVLSALILRQTPGEYAREMKAGLGFERASEDEMKERETVKAYHRGTVFQQGNEEENRESTHETANRAHEDELKGRKILKIRRKKEEGAEERAAVESAAAEAAAKEAETKEDMRAKKERKRDWADAKARKWERYYHNAQKATEERAIRRLGNECVRREEQSEAFVTWQHPVTLQGLSSLDNGKGVVLRWLDDEGKAQVQLEDGRLVAVADPQNVIREATRGAGVQRKDKRIKKRRIKEISRIKRAGGRKGPPKQEILEKVKQKRGRQTRTAANVPRTSDPKIRTKIMKNNNNGRNKGPPNTMGPWASDRGVMSLKIYSTKRETSRLIQRARTKARDTSESIIHKQNGLKHKAWGERPTPSKSNTKVGHNGWWKTPIPSRYNTKRIRRKGSTDVYLQKRSIELEID